MSTMSQEKAILKYLETHRRGLTPLDALRKFNCFRLSGRIYDLRQMGYKISTIIEEKDVDGEKKRYARYILEH